MPLAGRTWRFYGKYQSFSIEDTPMRAFIVLVDPRAGKVGINIKDSALPDKVMRFEGLINLFGGKVDEGETPEATVRRELTEEIPGFVNQGSIDAMKLAVVEDDYVVFAAETDLSGHRHTRDTDRIGQLAKVCREGDGCVRTIGFIKRSPDEFFVAPEIKAAIIAGYEAIASA